MVFPASSQATGNDGGLEYGTGRILRVMTLKESLKGNLDVSTDMKIEALKVLLLEIITQNEQT